jgi:hypothetical protein
MVNRINPPRTTFRSIAIPNEHGGWMFLLEPALIGLGAAFTAPGLFLALAALGAFLTRHPLKLALDDYLKRRSVPRTLWAIRFAALYALCAGAAFVAAFYTAQHSFLLPLLLAAPLALAQIYLDAHKRSRDLTAELTGAIAMGALAACALLLAGWDIKLAFAAWVIVILRAMTSILYVRARLRLERNTLISPLPAWASHVVALFVIGGLAYLRLVPALAVVAVLLWGIRALIGLSSLRRPARAQIVGIHETLLGLVTVALVVTGYWLKI